MSEALENIKTRRSIRKYKPDMVPQEILDKIIEAGLYAASGMGQQNTIIIQVTNKELRDKISKMNQEITFSCDNWNSGLASFESGEMSVVVVVDRYEGESAETIRNKLPDIIEKMQNTNAEATGVQGEIAEQISRLDEYIEKLEVKIGELRQQLAAL